MANIGRENNFDLIRLVAALQVVVWHMSEHLGVSSTILKNVIIHGMVFFPGVPIFFFVSGFLIYASFDRNKSISQYFKNRTLRIFPGLFAVFLFTLAILIIFGYLDLGIFLKSQFWFWAFGQITIFQFYTPDFLRDFGVGTPNGSLWTIFVEFSFYLFVPLVFWFRSKFRLNATYVLLGLAILSIAFNIWYQHYFLFDVTEGSIFVKLMKISLLPYLFYFIGGALVYENWEKIKGWYINKGLFWLLLYAVYCCVFSVWLKLYVPTYWPNVWALLSTILLMQCVISIAFTNVTISRKILNHNDISYGLYLFHMPIINLFLFFGFQNDDKLMLWVLLIVNCLAYLSWRFIEQPALKMKSKTKKVSEAA